MRVGYSKKVLEYFRNPKNIGRIDDASIVATVGSVACGDMIKLYLKIVQDKIEKATFESYGCAANIATSVAVTELVKGKNLEEAKKLSYKDVENFLDGLPRTKIHCAVLSVEALKIAILKYELKMGRIKLDESVVKRLLHGVLDPMSGKSIINSDKFKDLRVKDKNIEITLTNIDDKALREDIENQIREVFRDLDINLKINYE